MRLKSAVATPSAEAKRPFIWELTSSAKGILKDCMNYVFVDSAGCVVRQLFLPFTREQAQLAQALWLSAEHLHTTAGVLH